jgi:hypothetical protein
MANSKGKMKSCGDKASPCFTPFWIGKLSDKGLPIRTLQTLRTVEMAVLVPEIMDTPLYQQHKMQGFVILVVKDL